jgi:CarD family transcriptional regulator
MFRQGDRVVHPNHGAGVVKGLEGNDGSAGYPQYYVIELYANRLTMLVPVGNAHTLGLRLADGDLVEEALQVLAECPCDLPSEFKSRQKELMDKLRSGDTRLIAEVCRDLFHRSRAGQLTSTDSRVLEQARNFVATELAAVRGCEPEVAFEELAGRLDHKAEDITPV